MLHKQRKILVVRFHGTNCNRETVHVLKKSGATVSELPIEFLLNDPSILHDFYGLIFPGGFSYSDHIAAGHIASKKILLGLKESLKEFISEKKLVIGICNGFQILIKTGLLSTTNQGNQEIALIENRDEKFSCKWVWLDRIKSNAEWLNVLPDAFELPIANEQGRIWSKDEDVLKKIKENNQIVLQYRDSRDNGSMYHIAGLCNHSGNVVGLMPHPERYYYPFHHPNWVSQKINQISPIPLGKIFWEAAVKYVYHL